MHFQSHSRHSFLCNEHQGLAEFHAELRKIPFGWRQMRARDDGTLSARLESMTKQSEESADTQCLRCGAEAEWRFIDEEQKTIEIICPECGRFNVPRLNFEQAQFDIIKPKER